MIHHVALEVTVDDLAAEARFWRALGFTEVPVPEALGDGYSWFEHGGTQIHLMQADEPVVPGRAHVALVTPDFEATVERLRGLGSEVRAGRELWGERRAKVTSPGGHTVEVMAGAPPPAAG